MRRESERWVTTEKRKVKPERCRQKRRRIHKREAGTSEDIQRSQKREKRTQMGGYGRQSDEKDGKRQGRGVLDKHSSQTRGKWQKKSPGH